MISTWLGRPPTLRDTRRTLPIADGPSLRRHTRTLITHHRRSLALVLALHSLAALAALGAPWLVGVIVQRLAGGSTEGLTTLLVWVGVFVIAQTVLTWLARRQSFCFGEDVFAEMRERFVDQVTSLPLSTVEKAGTGDLQSRTTNDLDAVSWSIRWAVPSIFVALITILLTCGAAFFVSPLASLGLLVGIPGMAVASRWFLARAPKGYQAERASYAVINSQMSETVEGARQVEALGLHDRRRDASESAITTCNEAEMYTLRLRCLYFGAVDLVLMLPTVAVLAWGGWLVMNGHAEIGAITTVLLYAQNLVPSFDQLLGWLDELTVGAAAMARVVGVADVPPDRTVSGEEPHGQDIEATQVRYRYDAEAPEVLHGVDLQLRPGERLAIVGPSGAGKSTLGRLVAGIDGPTQGRVTVGDVPLVDLDLDTLRGEVALVTQEHHIFVGTLADNLRLARTSADDERLWAALAAVDADGWARELHEGLATEVGSGGHRLTEPQAQQVALARLVLADPHTLVLDEATSLLDPRAARHLERSLAAVVQGRTVVAIAHRLHTAHDADRVAVVDAGNIKELGSHDELIAADGDYAALWRQWSDQ